MSEHSLFSQLLAEVRDRSALLDDVAGSAEKLTNVPRYPRLFRELVECHTFLAFDVGDIRIYSNVQDEQDNLKDLLADEILTRELVQAGFLPFGRPRTGSYDRVCFDIRAKEECDDSPVVLMNHEAILSNNQIPKPEWIAESLIQLFEIERKRNKLTPTVR